MKMIPKIATTLSLGALVIASAAAFAQQAPSAAQPKRERPSAETMQRLQDGRFAMITTALKLTDDQKKLWAPVEAKMRETQANRMQRMQQRMEQRQQKQAAERQRPDMLQRMERMSQMQAERAEQSKAFLGVFKPFYESLTEEQKQVAGPLMAQMRGGKRGHHGGYAMHHRGGGMRGGHGMR